MVNVCKFYLFQITKYLYLCDINKIMIILNWNSSVIYEQGRIGRERVKKKFLE